MCLDYFTSCFLIIFISMSSPTKQSKRSVALVSVCVGESGALCGMFRHIYGVL